MKKGFVYTINSFNDERAAEEFFDAACDLRVFSAHPNLFDYSSQICKFGNSFVSLTTSSSGWGYESKAEFDGFLIAVPEAGGIKWCTGKERFNSILGELFTIDHREVATANYEAHVRYASMYLDYAEVFHYLSLLIGDVPRSRLFLTKKMAGKLEASCFAELVRTTLFLSSSSSLGVNRPLANIKECLINFWLYNVNHNFSRALSEPGSVRKLAPYSVNLVSEYILHNFDKDLTVSQLAASAGVSIRALQLSFKKFKNTTPMNYLRSVRLAKARSMLHDANCEMTAQQVADKCGFTNYYLFCRHYFIAFRERPVRKL